MRVFFGFRPKEEVPRDIDSQNRAILAHLEAGRSITPLEALDMYGCLRLSARIWDIRHQMNRKIRTETITRDGKRYARYTLESEG